MRLYIQQDSEHENMDLIQFMIMLAKLWKEMPIRAACVHSVILKNRRSIRTEVKNYVF
jgi:hypothetical protein